MKELLVLIFALLSGAIFYLYIYFFLFKEGYFSFINPFKPIKSADPLFKRINSFFFNFYGSIFPAWRLFIGMSNYQFYDLVVEAEFSDSTKKIWIGTEDLSFGSFDLKNKFFILSLISHYNSSKKYSNELIVKNILNYSELNNKVVNQIIINYLPFSFENLKQDRLSIRNVKKESKKLINKQFIWQNRKILRTHKNNLYELY